MAEVVRKDYRLRNTLRRWEAREKMFSLLVSRRFIILFFGLVLFALLIHFVGSREKWLFDSYDTNNYYRFGSWYTLDQKPYTEVFSPYPQLANYLFALPHVIASELLKSYDTMDYKLIFSLLMMMVLFATIFFLFLMRSDKKNYALLMVLPACIFFAHQRYDILPAFLGTMSIFFLINERYRTAAFFLALGVVTKWYLILLSPVLFRYIYLKRKKNDYSMIGIFILTGMVFVLLTTVHSGFDAVFIPYRFHLSRPYNYESLFYHVKYLFDSLFNINIAAKPGYFLFLLLQFGVVPFALRADIRTPRDVYAWSALSILCFMLFAKFYSPQWILWAMPFLILWISNSTQAWAVIVFDAATYLYFPVAFRNVDLSSIWFGLSIGFKNFLLILLMVLLVGTITTRDAHEDSKQCLTNLSS